MNRNTRMLLVVLIAVGAAAVASFAAYSFVSRMPVREVEVAGVPTVVAVRALPVGTLLTKDHLKVVQWPSAAKVPDSFSSIDEVANRGLVNSVGENEPLTQAKLAPVGSGGGLPPAIPEGMRAISVKVNEVIGVAGFVIPGTRVDVLVAIRKEQESFARAVVNNVTVLTAGTRFDQESAQREGKPIPTTVVTLIVTPEDAAKITLAAEQGRIMLTLRNPLDREPTVTPGARMASLMGAPNPAPVEKVVEGRRRVVPKAPPPYAAPVQKAYMVETIRAAKRSEEEIR